MNKITIDTLVFDVLERLNNALQTGKITPSIQQTLKSRNRVLWAINEAVKAFVGDPNTPLNALRGFVHTKQYVLDKIIEDTTTNIARYAWPTPAHQSRVDGGLLSLTLDGDTFEFTPLVNYQDVNAAINSLQYQASNIAMYGGASTKNAVVSMVDMEVYAPKDLEVKARVLVDPEPVTGLATALAKTVITVLSSATTTGILTVENITETVSITVNNVISDSPESIARRVAAAINDSTSTLKLTAVAFADEIWLYNTVPGASQDVKFTSDTSGATYSVAFNTTVSNNATETEHIDIDPLHQETLALSAFNQLVNNLAAIGYNAALPRED